MQLVAGKGLCFMRNADIMRLICIWFMVTAHIGSDVRDVIVQHQGVFLFLFDGLSRLSSPGLGFISGYLACLSLERSSYWHFAMKRVRSLLVPFLLWSMIYVGLLLAVGFLQGEPLDFNMLIGNPLWGLTNWPGNFPLHYLLDLFKCAVLMAGAFVLLTRSGLPTTLVTPVLLSLSLAVFLGLTLADLNASHPGRNQESFLPRSDLQLFFSLGFVYARTNAKIFGSLACRPLLLAVLGALFVVTSLVWHELLQNDMPSLQYWLGAAMHFGCRLAGALLLFSLIWRLPTPVERTSLFLRRLAFNVFVSHFIVLSALNSLFDLTPLLASSPALFLLALQSAFFLAGLLITLFQMSTANVDWLRRKTTRPSWRFCQAGYR